MLDYSTEIGKNNVEDSQLKSITFFVNYSLEDIELLTRN